MEEVEVKHEGADKMEEAQPYYKTPEDEDSDDLKKESEGPKKPTMDELVHQHELFHMREVVIPMPFGKPMRFNPIVSLLAIGLLWGVAIWCMVEPEDSRTTLVEWRARVAELFTWFYIGTNPAFMFFMIYVAFRYRNVRLGPPDSRPEFDDVTYFAMLFSAGIGVGLFFFGVSEPLWHQTSHWYAETKFHSQDEVDMFALNLTVFHWGVTGWSQYLVVALCAGLAGFRFGLPFTLRSSFYPLLGEYTWGYIGDVIDGFTIVATVAGVCTSLGLGAFQIAAGLERVGAIDEGLSADRLQTVHVITIWVITCIATISVVSGLSIGIKYLSQIGFGLGMLLLCFVLFMEKTNYLLNLIVQEIGYYFQISIFQLNFHTDAFGQLREGEGRAVDGKAAAVWWMEGWTIFYIGWWVAWGAFVGLFIARISRGRTIASVVMYSYVIPLAYTILWFGVFGGAGLRQSRQAQEMKALGKTLYNDTGYYLADDSTYCYDVPQEDVVMDGTTHFVNYLYGVTPVCEFSSADSDAAWFNVLNSFTYPLDFDTGFGNFLTWVSLFSVGIYFITSSDSGSLIVDNLASNGFEDTHWLQRVFWAFTEGSVATALLVSGGGQALRGLQAASILTGLPFTLFLVFMCFSILDMCHLAETNDKEGTQVTIQEHFNNKKRFSLPIFGGIFNTFEHILSLGNVHEARASVMPMPDGSRIISFVIATFLPFVTLYQVYSGFSPKPSDQMGNLLATAVYAAMFFMWIGLFGSIPVSEGLRGFGFTVFAFNGCILSSLRMTFRKRYGIEGNMVADYLMATFLWPQVLCQMTEELALNQERVEVDV